MASQKPDRFDRPPADVSRIGAHRSSERKHRGLLWFGWSALATLVLVVAGLFGISQLGNVDLGLPNLSGGTEQTPTPTPTPTPTAEPITDPATIDPARGISITVLNGSPTNDLEDTVGQQLSGAGWPVGTMTQASSRELEKTYVYYSDPANEDVARGVVLAMGFGDIRLIAPESMPSSAPITVVLGADFPVPAG